MTGKERVLAALEYREADRVPRFWDAFWSEFCLEFARRFPDDDPMRHFDNDLQVIVPMGRKGRPQEVANAILFLASDEASFITGEVMNINGGLFMD